MIWTDAKLRGIASDYFPDPAHWPAAMLCMRHLLKECAEAKPASAQPLHLSCATAGRCTAEPQCQPGRCARAAVPLSTAPIEVGLGRPKCPDGTTCVDGIICGPGQCSRQPGRPS